jgi:glycyl-tRNA synthetase beta chain
MSGLDFLLEVLCEEIPANALPSARGQLADGFRAALAEGGFAEVEVSVHSTVRRLVVWVSGLSERQPDRDEEVTGPSVRAAFSSDGTPTQAALGFAKALGVEIGALRVVKGAKGEVVAGTRHLAGRPTADVLAELVPRLISGLHFPKTMRWGRGEHTFVRPVHNVVALLGKGKLAAVVPLELFGVAAGSSTVGHRVAAPGPLELKGARGFAEVVARLEGAGVVVDHEARLEHLEETAATLAAEVGCEVRADAALVAEHVELVEYPGVVRGALDPRHLELPEEVLVTTLRHHQKCLVLSKDDKVAPYFLAVADRPDDPEGHVQQGNEWVAGARLADATFFFAQDRKQALAARVAGLERVVFHPKLGSFASKTAAVRALAPRIASAAGLKVDVARLERAAELLKADLVTAMVGEFPELQGVVGGIYARLDGEPEVVWQAVADQYTPAGLEGALPRGALAAVIGVADRLDTLAGLFAAGEIPTGSKDPFALRRAALAVVRVCAEAPVGCHLPEAGREALELRRSCLRGEFDAAWGALRDFLQERVRFYLANVVGASTEAADAVLAARWGVIGDDAARARALEAVRGEPVFVDLSISFKRVRNMVAKGGQGRADERRLREPAEKGLVTALDRVEVRAGAAIDRGDHAAGLRALAELAAPLERFFTDVLVLCDDDDLRAARLALLARVEQLFLREADLSRLSPQA